MCHLRDIECYGYHVRIQRMLDESNPSLVSLDGYEIARERRYESANLSEVLADYQQHLAGIQFLAGKIASEPPEITGR